MHRRSRFLNSLALFGFGTLIVAALFFVFAHPGAVHAQSPAINTGLSQVQNNISLGTQDIRVTVAKIIRVALGVLGVVILVFIIYAGYLWMTAGGDQDKVATAKKYIFNAVIGLLIVLAAFAIATFVISKLLSATGAVTDGPGFEQGVVSRFSDFSSGSLGEGIIQSHYPAPGATDIPRNTKIIVTFKEAMDPTSIIQDGKINAANIRIIPTSQLASGGVSRTSADKFMADVGARTVDNKTFVFIPSSLLGSPSERISYTVAFTGGANGIKRADGSAAFTGNYETGYHWEFETSTMVDNTPPKIVSVYPRLGSGSVPRNSIIQVTFNEAVDPVVSSGVQPGFTNVPVTANGTAVPGNWQIGNQYKTIEFRANEKAGTNSCGADVFVLPSNAAIEVTVKAATVGDQAPQAADPYPYDGVTDVAANSLDGNSNGKAEGAPADSVTWNFHTSTQIDLTPPQIESIWPDKDSSNVDGAKPISFTFDKPLAATTVSNATMSLESTPQISTWYFGEAVNLTSDDAPASSMSDTVLRTRADIVHGALAPSIGLCSAGTRTGKECAVSADCPSGTCTVQRFDYYPKAGSGITDLNQNCFYPACGSDPSLPYCCSKVACAKSCQVGGGGSLICPQ